MTEKKTWTATPTQAPSAAGAPSYSAVWGSEEMPLSAELISGGWIDELARAAKEHGIMITLTFVPGTFDPDEEPTA